MSEKKQSSWSKRNWKLLIVVILVLIIVISILVVPRYRKYINNKRAVEVKTAMEALRTSVDDYWKSNGSISGITLDSAIATAGISPKVLQKWQFFIAWKETTLYTTEMVDKLKDVNVNRLVYVSPYRLILAVATKDNPVGEGTKLWFVGDSNEYHGFGLDALVEPDWKTVFPNP